MNIYTLCFAFNFFSEKNKTENIIILDYLFSIRLKKYMNQNTVSNFRCEYEVNGINHTVLISARIKEPKKKTSKRNSNTVCTKEKIRFTQNAVYWSSNTTFSNLMYSREEKAVFNQLK